jgi:hypothetical protein
MKEINNILILIFITISIILLWKFTVFGNSKNHLEGFMTPGEAESISGNIEASDGSCKKEHDPSYVGKYVNDCCETNSSSICMCKLDAFKECRGSYDKCFEEKEKAFKEMRQRKLDNLNKVKEDVKVLEAEIKKQRSPLLIAPMKKKLNDKKHLVKVMQEEFEEEPEVPPGIQKQCQNEFAKCAKDAISISKTKYNESAFDIIPMKRRAPKANKICEFSIKSENDLPQCINYCEGVKECQGGVYNKKNRVCELYDKELIDKAEGARKADDYNINFMRRKVEGFSNGDGSGDDDGSRTKDIKNILDKVEKKKTGFKTCESTFNNNLEQLRESHKFTKLKLKSTVEPEYGSEVCRRHNISYDKCTDECLMNDKCDYLMYGSPVDSSGLDNTKYYSGGNKCVLYSGAPSLEGDSISLSKVDSGNGYSFYVKRLMSYDERVGLE